MKIEIFEHSVENEIRLVTFRYNYTNDILLKLQNTAVRINKSFKHIRIEKPSNLSSSGRPDVFLMVNRGAYLSIFPKKILKILRTLVMFYDSIQCTQFIAIKIHLIFLMYIIFIRIFLHFILQYIYI